MRYIRRASPLLSVAFCCCFAVPLYCFKDIPPTPPRLWLYMGMSGALPGSATLLQHWLEHYLVQLRFPRETFVMTVNYDKRRSAAAGRAEFARVRAVAARWDVNFTVWSATYSAEQHLQVKLPLLAQRGVGLGDWLAIADSDELHEYPAGIDAREFVRQLDRAGHNYVAGTFVDRLAEDGRIHPLDPARPLQEQFPLKCQVIRRLTHGISYKIMLAKGYFRTNRGNHVLVSSLDQARKHFSSREVYNATPYGRHPECYDRAAQNKPSSPCGSTKYDKRRYPHKLKVHHFKWHSGVVESAASRLRSHRGDDRGGRPRFGHYRESKRLVDYMAQNNGSLNLQEFDCHR